MIGIYRHLHVGRTCTSSFWRLYPPSLLYEDVEFSLTVEWKLAHLTWPNHADHFFSGRSADLGLNYFFLLCPVTIQAMCDHGALQLSISFSSFYHHSPSLFSHSFTQACRVIGPLSNSINFELDMTCECHIL